MLLALQSLSLLSFLHSHFLLSSFLIPFFKIPFSCAVLFSSLSSHFDPELHVIYFRPLTVPDTHSYSTGLTAPSSFHGIATIFKCYSSPDILMSFSANLDVLRPLFWIHLCFDIFEPFKSTIRPFSTIPPTLRTSQRFCKAGTLLQLVDSRYKQSHLPHRHHSATSEPALLAPLEDRSMSKNTEEIYTTSTRPKSLSHTWT